MNANDDIEPISLIDFGEVWKDSLLLGDCRHLWDWLNYNGYIKTFDEKGETN